MAIDVSGPLDDAYFEWLYRQIGSVNNRNPARSHWNLMRTLYTTPFVWSVRNDDNRSEDGVDLREDFFRETGFPLEYQDHEWLSLECSVLEMIVALSRRVAFEDEHLGSPVEWFWRLIDNLEMLHLTDNVFDDNAKREVERRLRKLINRTYGKNGHGGLFPLRHATQNQRSVELWYQMAAYLLEGDYVNIKPKWR